MLFVLFKVKLSCCEKGEAGILKLIFEIEICTNILRLSRNEISNSTKVSGYGQKEKIKSNCEIREIF